MVGDSIDKQQRRLSVVIDQNGVDINKKLLELGMVVFYRPWKSTSKSKEYEQCKRIAKDSKIGVWSDPTFEIPYKFRKRKNDTK